MVKNWFWSQMKQQKECSANYQPDFTVAIFFFQVSLARNGNIKTASYCLIDALLLITF